MNPYDTSRVLRAIARDHLSDDTNLLPGILARIEKGHRSTMTPRLKFAIAIVIAVLAVTAGLFSVPAIATALKHLLGYIPGVGIVDPSAPIRVLAQPVRLSREGITLSVTQGTLATDRTVIDYEVTGVPASAYPLTEASEAACFELPYLRLPDGTRSSLEAPLPPRVKKAIFVMPCIFNTLHGSTPTDWELPLKFVPAPSDMTVLPVYEATLTPTPVATPAGATSIPTTPAPLVTLTIDKVIQTSDGYILIGATHVQGPGLSRLGRRGILTLQDANGRSVPYTQPEDIPLDSRLGLSVKDAFVIQFRSEGVAYPLTLAIPGALLSEPDPNATAEFVFDAGENPKPGQEWALDQTIELAGYRLKLSSVRVDSRNDYHFTLNVPEMIDGVSVEVEGTQSVGHGGGSYSQGQIGASVAFSELPTGKLTFVFSHLVVASAAQSWQIDWQPETLPQETLSVEWSLPTPAGEPACLTANSIGQIPPLPAGFAGQALLTETNDGHRLVLLNLDGSGRREFASSGRGGALSPDGQHLAYPTSGGISILDLVTGASTMLSDQTESRMAWSPDGLSLAYVSGSELYGLYLVSVSGSSAPQKLSSLGYEAVAGWSPDGRRLYYAIPNADNQSGLLRSIDILTGVAQDGLTLENLSPIAPLAVLSPDEQWVAYRGWTGVPASETHSLYIKALDRKSRPRPLIDNPGIAITGIAWDQESHWLGISLKDLISGQHESILLQPSGCQAYHLPGLEGEIEELSIP